MLWHIFNNGWEDSEFLNQRVYGVDEIRKEVAKWSPKETERVTGLPEAQVRHIAEMFAKQKPATLIWARHYWRSRQGAPARPRSQGHQAGRHPPDPYERRNEAHGVRDRLTCALRTAGARSAGDHCRHTRLHSPRTNRAHEPLD